MNLSLVLSLLSKYYYYSDELLDSLTKEGLLFLTQKQLSFKVDSSNRERLVSNFETAALREKARLLSSCLPKAGNWLNAIPSKSLGLHLSSREFRVSAKYRLGMTIFLADGVCPACKLPSDAFGDHAIACGSEGERISRHNLLRDALFSAAQQAALSPVREERDLISNSQSRPGDIFLRSYHQGMDLAIDVTVISPVQKALVAKSAEEAGYALQHACDRKNRLHFEECQKEGIHFAPLAIETFGGFNSQSILIVNKIGRQLAGHTGKLESEVISHLYQRLSLLLAKGNSALILSRVLDICPAHVDGESDKG